MREPKGPQVNLEVEILKETDSAVWVTDGDITCWLPLSQVEVDRCSVGRKAYILMPEWLALDRGMI